MTDPSVNVFLISLKAGGVALNLTEASRCFIMDPWWNPACEGLFLYITIRSGIRSHSSSWTISSNQDHKNDY